MQYYDDDELFRYLNSDILLLVINILLEGYNRKQNLFTLNQFMKGDYWKVEEISEEIQDTGDWFSVEDLILSQIIYIVEEIKIGKYNGIKIINIHNLYSKVVKEIISLKVKDDEIDDKVEYYVSVISEITRIEELMKRKLEKYNKEGKELKTDMFNGVKLTEYEFRKYISFVTNITAPFVELEITFFNKKIKELQKELESYIQYFSKDFFIDDLPPYKDKRLYFTKQLENFYNYIKELPIINNCINIPFSTLRNDDFEIVKILKYLELKEKIRIKNWNDPYLWNVEFFEVPITIQNLIENQTKKNNNYIENNSKMYFEKYDKNKKILRIANKNISLAKKGTDTDDIKLLETLLIDKEKIWWNDEILEEWGYHADDKITKNKVYSSARNLQRKIKHVTNIDDFIEFTTAEFNINPRYLKVDE